MAEVFLDLGLVGVEFGMRLQEGDGKRGHVRSLSDPKTAGSAAEDKGRLLVVVHVIHT
jgi:hypothetical protein